VRQELKLVELNHAWELHDYLLGVLAELLRLPAFGVYTWLKQLGYRVVRILATAVDDFVVELDLTVWSLR